MKIVRFSIAVFILIGIFVAPVHSSYLRNWNIEVSLDGMVSNFKVTLEYNETITKNDYFINAKVSNVRVTGDENNLNCEVSTQELGTSIVCNNISAKTIIYEMSVHDLISTSPKLNIFRYRFPVLEPTERFSVTVKLPLGAVLVEQSELEGTGLQRYEPNWGTSGSDGRRIFVAWPISNPKVGETLNVAVIYEQTIEINYVLIGALVLIILIIVVGIFFYLRRSKIRAVLPVLTPSERKVMEILLREKGEVDQRQVVKETDFSKSKVSRVIQNLEDRGLIVRFKKGRANKIKILHRPEQTKKEEPKKENI